jgi:UDPglucose--hexose-1-phosphate uridylyltransferase
LCPGNKRAGEAANPVYESTNVFTNDFAALLPETEYVAEENEAGELIRSMNVQGTCRVVCFSPRHDLTLAEMGVDGIMKVIHNLAGTIGRIGGGV